MSRMMGFKIGKTYIYIPTGEECKLVHLDKYNWTLGETTCSVVFTSDGVEHKTWTDKLEEKE